MEKTVKKNKKEEKKKESITFLKEEINDIKDKLLREKAENENLRKRYDNIIKETHKFGVSKIAREMISHIEDLNRAIDAIKNIKHDDMKERSSLFQGLELVNKNFKKGLAKFDIQRIYPKGEKFDFNFHEAISQTNDKSKETDTVVEVIEAGYKIANRVLKPAKVIVSK